jgi:hypothetical protein
MSRIGQYVLVFLSALAAPVPGLTQQKTGPGVPADESLTWHGITLYGVIDIGLQYDTHSAPFTPYRPSASGNIVRQNSPLRLNGRPLAHLTTRHAPLASSRRQRPSEHSSYHILFLFVRSRARTHASGAQHVSRRASSPAEAKVLFHFSCRNTKADIAGCAAEMIRFPNGEIASADTDITNRKQMNGTPSLLSRAMARGFMR